MSKYPITGRIGTLLLSNDWTKCDKRAQMPDVIDRTILRDFTQSEEELEQYMPESQVDFPEGNMYGLTKRTILLSAVFVTTLVFMIGSYSRIPLNIDKFPSILRPSTFFDQETVGKEIFLLPDNAVLRRMNKSEFLSLIHRYTNTYQILCRNQLRVGTVYDGGKEVCLDEPVFPKKPCLVYSFGSNNNFEFEKSVIKWFGCKIHTFDPSMGDLSMKEIRNPAGCDFHSFGLAGENTALSVGNKKWTMKTLGTIIKELNHKNKTIDILKIDIEEAEWRAIDQMIDTGDIYKVRQLLVELHFDIKGTNFTYPLSVLKRLYDSGFRVFNRERNVFCPNCNVFFESLGYFVSFNIEMCYINTRILEKYEYQ